ncbi:ribokinase [Deinococcus peraridilitoris]|uniref:Ribokinase n=1 Tax=Deinococcus peraridilitoris (strain DSM 19664 / LMG 22246 / CIP 109416 / KR-200) TaxID=937777 RepID=L0A0H2_DEIPD|nr:ribokinase [Deinococcus peraridilitoris]AFZ67393.1 sugar kinase, ribokinase [Deinococcus peraridilitoris DSM 19664]
MILTAGSANLDFVVRVPHIAAPGETVLGSDTVLMPGGKGANQAVAAARAGGKVAFLGALGNDAFADMLLGSLSDSAVDTRHVRRVAAPTGAAYISVAENGENAITVAPGANNYLRPGDLPELHEATHLLLQLEIPLETVSAYASAARAAGVQVVLNAAPACALDTALLACVDILIVNEGELRALQGAVCTDGDLEELTAAVLARGPGTVVVTLGARGCFARSGQKTHRIPAYPVKVIDTTGAGDTFVGVMSTWLAQGAALPEALQAASAGAALTCTRAGAQPSMPGRQEILRLLADHNAGQR